MREACPHSHEIEQTHHEQMSGRFAGDRVQRQVHREGKFSGRVCRTPSGPLGFLGN